MEELQRINSIARAIANRYYPDGKLNEDCYLYLNDILVDDLLQAIAKGEVLPATHMYQSAKQKVQNFDKSKNAKMGKRCISLSRVETTIGYEKHLIDSHYVSQLFQALPETELNVMKYWIQGYTLAETSAALELPKWTVRNIYFRAIKRLRRLHESK